MSNFFLAFVDYVINHVLPNEASKDHSLLPCPRVFQIERHHFVEVPLCINDEDNLLLVIRVQGNLIVAEESVYEA